MQCLTDIQMQASKRVLRYLKGTIDHGLQLTRTTFSSLQGFYDSDWAGDISDRKSTGAYIIYFESNPISWSCKKQPIIVKSFVEAEYRTIASTTTEILWLQELLKELNHPLSNKPLVHSDNLGATYL